MNPLKAPSSFRFHPSSLPPDIVLRVDNVSKKFCRNLKRSMWYGVTDLAKNFIGGSKTMAEERGEGGKLKAGKMADGGKLKAEEMAYYPQVSGFIPQPSSEGLRPSEFWALRNISFELKRGECLGLIGQNGCGKSTLLRLIAGIFPPDEGIISIRGRVGALIALGAGFHPHLTGRENIFLNGAILGLSQGEIKKKFDEIVEFAEIGDFLDAPVSTYSSGMRVRLGFAVATCAEPELLLIDEVLAVGDMQFQRKCLEKLKRMQNLRTSFILVSHVMKNIMAICPRSIWIANGVTRGDGSTREILQEYSEYSDELTIDSYRKRDKVALGLRYGSGEMQVSELKINGSHNNTTVLDFDDNLCVSLKIHSEKRESDFKVWIAICDRNDAKIMGSISPVYCFDKKVDDIDIACEFKRLCLLPGVYKLCVAVMDSNATTTPYDRIGDIARFAIRTRSVDVLNNYDSDYYGAVNVDAEWGLCRNKK